MIMNIFLLEPTQRILKWREFRKTLKNNIDEKEQLELVAEFWSHALLQTYSIDYDNPNTWPSPWELIYEGGLCQTAIAYLMVQTLILSGWNNKRIELYFLKNEKEQIMAVVIDNKYILNFS